MTDVIDLAAYRTYGVIQPAVVRDHVPVGAAAKPCPTCGVAVSMDAQVAWALDVLDIDAREADSPARRSFERYRERQRFEVHRLAVMLEGYCHDHMWPECHGRYRAARKLRLARERMARKRAQGGGRG